MNKIEKRYEFEVSEEVGEIIDELLDRLYEKAEELNEINCKTENKMTQFTVVTK